MLSCLIHDCSKSFTAIIVGVAYFHKVSLLLKLPLYPHNNLQLLSISAVIDSLCIMCVIFGVTPNI